MQQRLSIRWIVALIALAIHTSAVVHLTVVTHVRCEHGEWVEVGAKAERAATQDAIRAVTMEPGAHHHEHCLAARIGGSKPIVSRVWFAAPQSADTVLRDGHQCE